MRIGVYGHTHEEAKLPAFVQLCKRMIDEGLEYSFFKPLADFLQKYPFPYSIEHTYTSNLEGIDYIISAGGDGTLLSATKLAAPLGVPVIGLNIGHLGFLASISSDEIKSLVSALKDGSFLVQKRTLIEVSGLESSFALNECSILKQDSSSMIRTTCYLDGLYLASYYADGLIISTPTGSTGYNLSVGGPIVSPTCSNFIISPICPHNLTLRPIVVSDRHIFTIKVSSKQDSFLLALDSQSQVMPTDTVVELKKSEHKLSLLTLPKQDFYSTLRKKLNWGIEPYGKN